MIAYCNRSSARTQVPCVGVGRAGVAYRMQYLPSPPLQLNLFVPFILFLNVSESLIRMGVGAFASRKHQPVGPRLVQAD